MKVNDGTLYLYKYYTKHEHIPYYIAHIGEETYFVKRVGWANSQGLIKSCDDHFVYTGTYNIEGERIYLI